MSPWSRPWPPLVTWLLLLCQLGSVSLFLLEGSPNGFAQFRATTLLSSSKGNLSLELKTDLDDAIVVYVDNHGREASAASYLELALIGGKLRARFKWEGAKSEHLLTLNQIELNDYQWHKIGIERNNELTKYSVDNEVIAVKDEIEEQQVQLSSYLYVGGLPRYAIEEDKLRLASVVLRQRFRGQMDKIAFADDKEVMQVQQMLAFKGVRESDEVDLCLEHECGNGGHCYMGNEAAVCDCANTGHHGSHCQLAEDWPSATFVGLQYLWLSPRLSAPPLISTQERLALHFKTRKSAGLLFFAGNERNEYLSLALKRGALLLRVQIDEKRLERHYDNNDDNKDNNDKNDDKEELEITPHLNDNKWHEVVVERTLSQVSVSVDGVFTERWVASSGPSSSPGLEVSTLFLGGSEATFDNTEHEHNFVGCIRNVIFECDGLKLNLLEMAQKRHALVRSTDNIEFECRDIKPGDPLAFTKSLSSWSPSTLSSGLISLTTESSFLVLPPWQLESSGSLRLSFRTTESQGLLLFNSGQSSKNDKFEPDYFALELIEGHLYLHIVQNGQTLKIRASRQPLDDGLWHSIEISLRADLGRFGVDQFSESFELPLNIEDKFRINGKMYLGGVDYHDHNVKLPPQLWTAALRRGFVGCVKGLVVNGAHVDLVAMAHQQDVGAIRSSCHEMALQCHDQPCLHGGQCREGWNRYSCDCTQTSFAGAVCGHRAATYEFEGGQWLRLSLPKPQTSESEDLSLRFRTSLPSSLLLETTHHRSQDKLELALDSGRVRLRLKIDHVVDKTVHVGESLNDDVYHTIKYERRGTRVKLRIDDAQMDEAIVTEIITATHINANNRRRGGLQLSISHLSIGGSSLDDYALTSSSSFPNFRGFMQHLVLNNQELFQLASQKLWMPKQYQSTAKLIENSEEEKTLNIYSAVHLKSSSSFLGLPQLKAYNELRLTFRFRTFEKNGLLMFNGGKARDFIAIEMVDGRLVYTLNLGYGPISLSSANQQLDDNIWHHVVIGRVARHRHVLVVDNNETHVDSRGDNHHLDLDGILYLGGLRENSYHSLPRPLSSTMGFQGCIASVEANGELVDPIRHALVTSPNVEQGCRDAVAFEFGLSGNGGVVRYMFDSSKRPDTSEDELSLGFIAASSDAIVIRVDSFPDFNRDFLQISLVNGKVVCEYNLGAKDVRLSELSADVSDGSYHVLRFSRRGANSSLQIDDNEAVNVTPLGNKHLTVFNDQAVLQVGGLVVDRHVDQALVGVVAGVNFNGLRPLDLAANNKNNLVSVVGDAKHLAAGIPFDFRARRPELFTEEAMQRRREQRQQLQQQRRQQGAQEMSQCDDEDDCVDGSGSGQFDAGPEVDGLDDVSHEQHRQEELDQHEPSHGHNVTHHVGHHHLFPVDTDEEEEWSTPTLMPLPKPADEKESDLTAFDPKWNLAEDASVYDQEEEQEPEEEEELEEEESKSMPATMVLVIGIIFCSFLAMVIIVIIVLTHRPNPESAANSPKELPMAEPPPPTYDMYNRPKVHNGKHVREWYV